MKYVTRLIETLWGIFAWLVFLICALFTLLAVTIVPFAALRHRLATFACRAVFPLSGIRVSVRGLDRLPTEHAVVVANHASYIDGFLLKGCLPARFSFVIKGEMRDVPVLHFLLRRAGARFVERFVAEGSSRDARQVVKAARDGTSLAFFPEGTFVAEPGIGRFRPGAFVAATRASVPLVPAAIRGTRHMLPSGRKLPRYGRLTVDILDPLLPDDAAFSDARALAIEARQRLMVATGEPDRGSTDEVGGSLNVNGYPESGSAEKCRTRQA